MNGFDLQPSDVTHWQYFPSPGIYRNCWDLMLIEIVCLSIIMNEKIACVSVQVIEGCGALCSYQQKKIEQSFQGNKI